MNKKVAYVKIRHNKHVKVKCLKKHIFYEEITTKKII